MQDGRPARDPVEQLRLRDQVPGVEPLERTGGGGAAEPRDPPVVPYADGGVPLPSVGKEDEGGQRTVRAMARDGIREREPRDRVGIGGHERPPAQVLPRVSDPAPGPEDLRLVREFDREPVRRPRRHLLADRLRTVVEVEEERFRAVPVEERHRVAAQRPAQHGDDRFRDLEGEGTQPRSKPRGEDHRLHGVPSAAAFSDSADKIGRSLPARARIGGFRSKFPRRWATVGGMKRR